MEPTEAGGPQAGGYEFSAAHNDVISRAGTRTRWWGILTLAAGILMLVGSVATLFSGQSAVIAAAVLYALVALIPVFVGLNFMRAGRALEAVVKTSGSDVGHLMRALDNLGRAFLIQLVAAVVWLALVVLGVVLALTQG